MAFLSQRLCFACCLALTSIGVVNAQSFAALVSPPRFELTGTPGKTVRAVVEITNADSHSAQYKIKTADWSLDKDSGVQFQDALQPGSCRPWVAIERREITVSAGAKIRYRFEINPPANTPATECRFALMIEGGDSAVETKGGLSFPVNGRIGLIVYLAVGAVAPQLEVVGSRVNLVNGVMTPVIVVKNSGNAHGRLTGFLNGTDSARNKLEFTPSNLPILAGETQTVPLSVNQEEGKTIAIRFPITINGTLEWDDKRIPFEQRFAK